MDASTLTAILSDPEFDPCGIFEQALTSFIQNHPSALVQDEVALKHLVKDRSLSRILANHINMDNLPILQTLCDVVQQSLGYDASSVYSTLAGRLHEISQEFIDEALNILIPYVSLDKVDAALLRTTKIIGKRISALTTRTSRYYIEPEEWAILCKDKRGQELLIREWNQRKVSNHLIMIQSLSTIAKSAKEDSDPVWREEMKSEIMTICQRWSGYICFKCGHGTSCNTGRTHRRGRIEYASPEEIQSLSGYTLHRKKCDMENSFLSPHEIFYGYPKIMTYACPRCGALLNSKSGLALHQKKCSY